MIIRKAKVEDTQQIYELYKSSARAYPHSLTQHEDEITLDYIKDDVIQISLDLGLILVAENNSKIIGSFKAYTSPYRTLAHIMANGTFVVYPDYEGKKAYAVLFRSFLKELSDNYQHIYKLEGIPHESNKVVINYYLKNEFIIEAVLKNKIRNVDHDFFDNEVVISWFNPNFKIDKLKKYYSYTKDYLHKKYI